MVKSKQKSEGGLRTSGHTKRCNGSLPPLVSIITATINAEKSLERCILSVLEQSYENIEFIIIDGGSTDATLDIVRKYETRIDYWISENDYGIYDALNKGIDLSRGEWLYFLGSDDRLYDNNVLTNIPFHKTQSKMIYGNVVLENDGIVGHAGKIYDGKFSIYKLAKRNICHQASFYKKEIFDELGKYDERYPMLADWVFNMRVFASKKAHPTFVNRNIAIYANQGLSDKKEDINFANERDTLVKKYLGLKAYFFMKFSESKAYRYGSRFLKRFV